MNLNEWRDEAYEVSKSKGWYDSPRSFGDRIALVHSELSEALEEFRTGHRPNEVYFPDAWKSRETHTKGKPEGIPIELADVLIRVFDMAGYYNIDIEEAVRIKHEFNKTRMKRHGGKKL